MRPILFRKERERLMEIKEEQLKYECSKLKALVAIHNEIVDIYNLMKGGKKDGKKRIQKAKK